MGHPVEEWIERLSAGESLRSIGAEVGLSGERVRQLVTRERPDKPWLTAAHSNCDTCGGGVVRPRKRFCSDRCARLWKLLQGKFRVTVGGGFLRRTDTITKDAMVEARDNGWPIAEHIHPYYWKRLEWQGR